MRGETWRGTLGPEGEGFPSGFPPAAVGLPACLRFAAVPDLGRAPLGVWVRSGTPLSSVVGAFLQAGRPTAPPSGGTVTARAVTALCGWCAGAVRGGVCTCGVLVGRAMAGYAMQEGKYQKESEQSSSCP